MTQKQKLADYDRVAAELGKLQLAIHDLKGESKFRFGKPVTVKPGEVCAVGDVPPIRVSVSPRGMPIYMVEIEGFLNFHYECEIPANETNSYWRVVRHAMWMLEKQNVA